MNRVRPQAYTDPMDSPTLSAAGTDRIKFDEATGAVQPRGTRLCRKMIDCLTSASAPRNAQARELVNALKFDHFKERIHCKLMMGIDTGNFGNIINRIAKRYEIPAGICDELVDGAYCCNNQAIVQEFKFNKGDAGVMLYGRVVTLQEDNKVDLAYTFYELNFKVSPQQVHKEETKKILMFNIKDEVLRDEEIALSEEKQDYLRSYFRQKAINRFQEEYGPNMAIATLD